MSEPKKTYLGDSVYARMDNGMVALTTENGYEASNEIFLEPEVIEALMRFIERGFNIRIKITKHTPLPEDGDPV